MDTKHNDANAISHAADLRRVVDINENIKQVIRISSQLNLTALNAMLVAKHAGEISRGFRVVSAELRVFSSRLEESMIGLERQISEQVKNAADMQKEVREQRHRRNIAAQGGRARDLIWPILSRSEEIMAEMAQFARKNWHNFDIQIGRALRLCETGEALSRNAKIEAVYGGAMSASLKQVADRIEEIVNDILATLHLLRSKISI